MSLTLTKNNKLFSFQEIIILLLFESFLFNIQYVNGLSILILIVTLFLEKKENTEKRSRNYILLFLTICVFCCYFLPIFVHQSIFLSFDPLVRKLPLLLIPIYFLNTSNKLEFCLKNYKTIYLLSLLTLIILSFLIQTKKVIQLDDYQYFFNDHFGSFFNRQAVYFALYINIGVVILLLHDVHEKINIAKISILIIFLACEVLLASRTSLALSFLIIILSFVRNIKVSRHRFKSAIFLMFFLSIFTITIFSVPYVKNRLVSLSSFDYSFSNKNPINHFNAKASSKNWDGHTARLAIWECSVNVIKKKLPLGYGIGNVPDALKREYKKNKFYLALEQDFNTHNQFLDVLISSGIIGLMFFLAFYMLIIAKSYLSRNYTLMFIWFVIIFASMTENILNRNQGLILFALILGITVKILQDHVENLSSQKIKQVQ